MKERNACFISRKVKHYIL